MAVRPTAWSDIALALEQLGRGAEVSDVGHARTDEHLIDGRAGDFGQRLHVIRIVRTRNHGLVHVGKVYLDDGRVLGVGVRRKQLRIGQPGLHRLDPARDAAHVLVAVRDHPLEHDDIRRDVFDDRCLVEMHGAAGGRTLCGCIGQFERLLHFQVRQTFDLKDATRKDVLLALLGDRQHALANRVQRDRIDEIAQRDTGCTRP